MISTENQNFEFLYDLEMKSVNQMEYLKEEFNFY